MNNKKKGHAGYRREIPAYADPIYRLPLKPTEMPSQVIPRKNPDSDIDTLEWDIRTDFEENSPYQKGVISETYQRPDKSYFQEQPELHGLVSTGNLVQKFLPNRLI